MKISMLFPAICMAAFCAGQLAARAQEDNPAQAAARAALMEKMNGLEAQPVQPAPPTIVVAPAGTNRATSGPQTNAVAVSPATAPKQPMVPAPQTKAPLTMGKAPTAPAPATPPAPPVQPAAVNPAKPAPSPFFTPVAMPPAKPGNPNSPGMDLGLKPIVAPPLPISPAKEAQLEALLARYKADQITAEQYQTTRARILAAP